MRTRVLPKARSAHTHENVLRRAGNTQVGIVCSEQA
jgi:hypothetical protein